MRYWQIEEHTFGTSSDELDLSALEPRAVELTEQEWVDGTEALAAASVVPPPPAPIVTSLRGNAANYATHPSAKRVTVLIISPVGGNVQGRPTVNGSAVCATPGGSPIVFDRPGALAITTRAGNNDLMIVEEF